MNKNSLLSMRDHAKSPELVIKKPRTSVEATNVWDWEN